MPNRSDLGGERANGTRKKTESNNADQIGKRTEGEYSVMPNERYHKAESRPKNHQIREISPNGRFGGSNHSRLYKRANGSRRHPKKILVVKTSSCEDQLLQRPGEKDATIQSTWDDGSAC